MFSLLISSTWPPAPFGFEWDTVSSLNQREVTP